MTDTLFPIEPSLSPRLRWLEQNCLALVRLESGRWQCSLDEENFARGDDADEAAVNFCVKTGMKHWSQL